MDHTFSLPSLSKDQETRLQTIPKNTEPGTGLNSEVARCSAVFLSKYVTSLNRKVPNKTRQIDDAYNRRSMFQNRHMVCSLLIRSKYKIMVFSQKITLQKHSC